MSPVFSDWKVLCLKRLIDWKLCPLGGALDGPQIMTDLS
jgi:hypothetical protein